MEASSRIFNAAIALLVLVAALSLCPVELTSGAATANFVKPAPIASIPFSFWKGGTASPTPTPTATPQSTVATYSSDGDTNGVFYFYGKNLTVGGTWTNPNTAGRLPIAASTLNVPGGNDRVEKLVDRTSNHCDTTAPDACGCYTFDLGSGRNLLVNKMSFRWRPDDSTAYTPSGWLLQGSNDNSSFTTLLTVSGATPGLGTWRSDTVSTGTTYRYFRVKRNGTMNGTDFFAVNEIELYGTLTY